MLAIHEFQNLRRTAKIQDPARRITRWLCVCQTSPENRSDIRGTPDFPSGPGTRSKHRDSAVLLNKLCGQVIEIDRPRVRLLSGFTESEQSMFQEHQSFDLRIAAIPLGGGLGQRESRHNIRNVSNTAPKNLARHIFA